MSFWKCFSCLRYQSDDTITKVDYTSCSLNEVPVGELHQYQQTIEALIVSSNHITEIPQEILLSFPALKLLQFNDNELDQLPPNVGQMRQLQQLDVSRNSIKRIPDSIKLMKSLTHLDLSLNSIQRLPDAITNLVSLEELLLNETYLEFLPANIGRLCHLKILELRSNNLITLPKSIGLLTDLHRLDIGANELIVFPEAIGNLNQLRELWIDFNKIIRLPGTISNLIELIHFDASNNKIQALPNELSNWRNLQVLSVSNNDIEDLPFSIGMLHKIVVLKCDNNQLKELPDSISHLTQLEELVLSQNSIMRLPHTIGALKSLKFCQLDENILRRLPSELSDCQNLTVLSVHSNHLNELPDNIGMLANLRVLNVCNNMISYLPVSILNLFNLYALWLYENQTQPLIPLQYYDENQLYLTCNFLPQQQQHVHQMAVNNNGVSQKLTGVEDGSDTEQKMYILDNDGNYEHQNEEKREHQPYTIKSNFEAVTRPPTSNPPIQWLYFQQRQQAVANRNNQQREPHQHHHNVKDCSNPIHAATTSPSKRICFADDENGDVVNKNDKSVKTNKIVDTVPTTISATKSVTEAALQSKLMRSPTPYPKELRIMAKYIRNQQQNHHNQQQQLQFIQQQKQRGSEFQRDVSAPNNIGTSFGEVHPTIKTASRCNNNAQQQVDHTVISDKCATNGNNSLYSTNSQHPTSSVPVPIQQEQLQQQDQQLQNSRAITSIIQSDYDKISIQEQYETSIRQKQQQLFLHQQQQANPYDLVDYSRVDPNNVYNIRRSSSSASIALQQQKQQKQNTSMQYKIKIINTHQQRPEQEYQIPQHPQQQLQNVYFNNGFYPSAFIPMNDTSDFQSNNNNNDTAPPFLGAVAPASSYPSTSTSISNQYSNSQLVHYLTVVDPTQTSTTTQSLSNSSSVTNLSPHSTQQTTAHNLEPPSAQNHKMQSPPPYYVAKNYTKKSQEDLLSYDTLRNIKYSQQLKQLQQQRQHYQHDIETIELGLSDYSGTNDVTSIQGRDATDGLIYHSQTSDIDVKLNFLNNNMDTNKTNDLSVSCDAQNTAVYGAYAPSTEHTDEGHDRQNDKHTQLYELLEINDNALYNTKNHGDAAIIVINDDQNTRIDVDADDSNSQIDSNSKLSASSKQLIDKNTIELEYILDAASNQKQKQQHRWLFGTHKNPTVKQLQLKKDPSIGFDIREVPHQGIFVDNIIPNTSASQLLKINDKLLDVDGFDFTKLSYARANKILIDGGPVFSIMISRK